MPPVRRYLVRQRKRFQSLFSEPTRINGQPNSSAHIWESNIIWAPLAIAIGLFCAGFGFGLAGFPQVAFWFFVAVLPFSTIAAFAICWPIPFKSLRYVSGIGGSALIAGLLFYPGYFEKPRAVFPLPKTTTSELKTDLLKAQVIPPVVHRQPSQRDKLKPVPPPQPEPRLQEGPDPFAQFTDRAFCRWGEPLLKSIDELRQNYAAWERQALQEPDAAVKDSERKSANVRETEDIRALAPQIYAFRKELHKRINGGCVAPVYMESIYGYVFEDQQRSWQKPIDPDVEQIMQDLLLLHGCLKAKLSSTATP